MTIDTQPSSLRNPRMEALRMIPGFSIERFEWYHSGCKIEEVSLEPINSTKIDPASGDFRPQYRRQIKCLDHNVVSAIENTVIGQ